MRVPRLVFIAFAAASFLPARAQFVIEYNSPVRLVRTSEDSWFADFGKDAFGTLILQINTDRRDTLEIHLGEKLAAPGRIDRKPGGSIRYTRVMLPVGPDSKEYVINLPPDKRNTNPPAVSLPDSFGVVMPFRYCEIKNFRGILVPGSLKQKAFSWKFNPLAGRFYSSDTILNAVWELCKYTIKATSFTGCYIDGDREGYHTRPMPI